MRRVPADFKPSIEGTPTGFARWLPMPLVKELECRLVQRERLAAIPFRRAVARRQAAKKEKSIRRWLTKARLAPEHNAMPVRASFFGVDRGVGGNGP